MRKTTVWAAALLLAISISAFAQMRQERGEHHQKLDFFVGEWATTDTIPPGQMGPGGVAHGKSGFKWTLGDLWLVQTYAGDMPGMGHYEGRGMITWDAEAGDYVVYWFDNFGARISIYRGKFVDENTMVFGGEGEMQGMKYYDRLTWKKVSEKELLFTMEMSMDGKDYGKTMESVYKR
jgi:hypothetical protein